MTTANPPAIDPSAQTTYRRLPTMIWAAIMTVVFVGLASMIATGYADNGFFPTIAPFAVVAPFLIFAGLGLAWPHVILRAETLVIRNSYATYVVPYGLIKEVLVVRIGMFIRTHDNRKIPVTAYASGSASARVLGHKRQNVRLNDAIEDKVSWARADVGDATVTRTINVTNLVITGGWLVVSAVVILLAVATYH